MNENIFGSKIRHPELADAGEERLRLGLDDMPVLSVISGRFGIEKPFKGLKVLMNGHVTKETAAAALAMKAGGAEVLLTASSPASTQDDVAASLAVHHGIRVMADSQMSETEMDEIIEEAYRFHPDLLMDEGAEMLTALQEKHPDSVDSYIGATIQTTSGVSKCRLLEEKGLLKRPVCVVNSGRIKHMFDNYFGVAQSALVYISDMCNHLLGGETIVVVGYGNVGKGIALRAKGMGAHVIVCEIDPINALCAYLEGYSVMSIEEAAKLGTIFITATGSIDVIPFEAIKQMKHGAVLVNCGSGQNEIAVSDLKENAVAVKEIKPQMVRYYLDGGLYVTLLCDGRVANIVGGEGNSPDIMDLTFSAVLLSAEQLVNDRPKPRVYVMSEHIDEVIASIKLNEYEIQLSKKTQKQKDYDADWRKTESRVKE